MSQNDTICVVGLGYVGLPLAIAFSKKGFDVIGFDVNEDRIKNLTDSEDLTNEVSSKELKETKINFSNDASKIKESNFVIVAVPTPITKDKEPDLSFVKGASEIVGKNLKEGSVVVFESTVYPGVTEDICVPIIEKFSGMKSGEGFKIGYSPERINPGDDEHNVYNIVKVVSGMDEESSNKIAEVYSKVIDAGVFKAKDIKTAEAAKVIENIQRDLNIALMNELSMIFSKIGLNTKDVIDAAGTKWNFHKYVPGLVGGHCIGVDPYYLTYKAKELGYNPKVILAGRNINDYMPKHISEIVMEAMGANGKKLDKAKVAVMGMTFKENVPDTRNSKVIELIMILKNAGIGVIGVDPLLSKEKISEFGVTPCSLDELKDIDCVIIGVIHDQFKSLNINHFLDMMEKPIVIDVKGFLDKDEALEKGVDYFCL